MCTCILYPHLYIIYDISNILKGLLPMPPTRLLNTSGPPDGFQATGGSQKSLT